MTVRVPKELALAPEDNGIVPGIYKDQYDIYKILNQYGGMNYEEK